MEYNQKVLDYYHNPRNLGSLERSDPAVGTGVVRTDAEMIRIQIKVNARGQVVEEACFKTFGCGYAIAASSLAAEWIQGRTLEEALSIRDEDIARELDFPAARLRISAMAAEAIGSAIADYLSKNDTPMNQE